VKQDVGRLFRITAPRPPEIRATAIPSSAPLPRPEPLYHDAPWDGSWWGTRAALNPRPLPTVEHAGTPATRQRLRREAVDPNPAVRRIAVEDLAPDRPSRDFLLGRLEADRDPPTRRAILASLVRQEAPELPALAARLVEGFDPDLFEDACRLLRDSAAAARALDRAPTPAHAVRLLPLAPPEAARARLRHPDPSVRAAAVQAVADRDAIPELLDLGAEALPALIRMPDARAERLYRAALPGPSSELRLGARRALAALGLESGPPPAPPSADVPGGEPARGRALFAGPLGCARCHAVGAEGGDVGPELTMVGAVYDRRTLAEHVLFPDRIIHGAYRSTVLRLASGDVVSGVLRSETALEIHLQGADGRVIAVRKADVEARRVAETSIMPAGLVDGLPASDFADLLAYLETLKGEE
jgi:putative heme-binding domain-containing protein